MFSGLPRARPAMPGTAAYKSRNGGPAPHVCMHRSVHVCAVSTSLLLTSPSEISCERREGSRTKKLQNQTPVGEVNGTTAPALAGTSWALLVCCQGQLPGSRREAEPVPPQPQGPQSGGTRASVPGGLPSLPRPACGFADAPGLPAWGLGPRAVCLQERALTV